MIRIPYGKSFILFDEQGAPVLSSRVGELKAQRKYPVYYFTSDTTGEKDFEEFYTDKEDLDFDRFRDIGVIRNPVDYDDAKLDFFTGEIQKMKSAGSWTRGELIDLFNYMIPEFAHKETGKFLDSRM